MFQTNEITAAKVNTPNTKSATPALSAKSESTIAVATTAREATKDAGRVHVGGGMMRF